MKGYHMRRSEKEIEDEEELIEIIKSQKFMTIAMCWNDEPYLVTLNYGFDEDEYTFYFHCAEEGKKIDYLKQENRIWGQVMDDLGYKKGECDHSYRSVHFKGCVNFLEDIDKKKEALGLMIEQLEEEPQKVKKTMLENADLEKVNIVEIRVLGISGKKNV